MLTLREVADYLQVHPNTIYRLLKQGKIPAVKAGRDWRFHSKEIDQWIAAKELSMSPRVRR
jgi:excisionase family DNA binding protein